MFTLNDADKGNNDSHKKADIIKTVSEAQKNIYALQDRARKADKDSKAIYSTEAEKVFNECLAEVSKKITNDHILCLLLKELDKDKKDMDKDVSACRHLLFAAMLHAENNRLMNRVTGGDEFEFPELRLWEYDPDALIGYDQRIIYGYTHAVYGFKKSKNQNPKNK